MASGKLFLLIASSIAFIYGGDGCQMDGVANWFLTVSDELLDTDRGAFFSRNTANIEELVSMNSGEGVNAQLYLSVSMEGSNFVISTTNAFAQYEENETSESMSFTVNFRCTGGTTNTLVFDILVRDTNNNPPTFRPNDQYAFTITPPLPPNFQITGCLDDNIIVRDIDLTTERIDFSIQENPYFEIAYDGRSTSDPKEFVAVLRTKDLIRTLPEVVELTISATDVDRTGDPPITTTATIRIQADDEFQFPEELVFSQPFYTATYSNNQLTLQELISLQQGFHEEVTFTLEGEFSEYFILVPNENQIAIDISNPLPTEILRSGQIILVVRAEREHTSGATSTVIIQLPEVLGLEFEQSHYVGAIVDNALEPIQLYLRQGYEDGVNITILNEYASFFAANIQENVITLIMSPLDANIIDENNFINLQVVAYNEHSTSTTVVTLDVVKDDNITPVFEQAIYIGEYNPDTGLTLEQITLVQGYDETVSFSLQGDRIDYFQITTDGPSIILTSSVIPTELWTEQQLYLTIEAVKPRTVNAISAILIRLPAEKELAFEAPTYTGTLQDDALYLQPIVLSVGYSEDVIFSLDGDYESYFTISNVQNQVIVNLSTPLPEAVILENSFLTLTLGVTGLHAVPTSATVLLEIIKQDVTTPVFTENIYRASYSAGVIEIGNIRLAQGYDNTVTFRLEGDYAQYFQISGEENNLNVLLTSDIPPEVIFQEKVLLFNVLADKPLTVGANAAISITFPQELIDATIMRFAQNTYFGSLEDNDLLSLENIVLETGYDNGTEFALTGEYSSYFSIQSIDNTVSISLANSVTDEILQSNRFIFLELAAYRQRAVSASTSIVIDIIEEIIVTPLFSEAYYRGVYTENLLHFNEIITLSQGYDDTVTFTLDGENAVWFSIVQNGNSITLLLNNTNTIPEEILESNNQLLFTVIARKTGVENGRAVVSIDLPKELPEPVIMRFTQNSYVGRIENGVLYAPTITLLGDREPFQLNLTGDYAAYFELSLVSNNIQIQLINELPTEVLNEFAFIIFDIEASHPEAINGYTTIVLEVIKQPQIVNPVFELAYYTGEYSEQELQFEQSIRLIQGFDETVLFTLAGDDAQWFELVYTDESNLSLVISDIGLEQIKNTSHLVFSIVANKPNSIAGQAAIIISLTDFTPVTAVRFSQDFYMGSIDNGALDLTPISLVEGYSSELNISLTGDHAEFFQLTNQDGIFTIQLFSELPPDVMDINNVLVFTLEVQAVYIRTHTTIILELVKAEPASLAFEATYFQGTYSLTHGLTFESQISLTEGYDESVWFSLEGEHSQWFAIVENQNPISIIQVSPIPTEVLSSNYHLVFIIVAENSRSTTTRSTIIISIIDDTTVLAFERNIYLGNVENNVANIDSIFLSEGYSQNVSFTLLGELASYFAITQEGSMVTLSMASPIPDELIPNSELILLEIEASTSVAISAYTTLVLSVAREDPEPLIFSEIYYTGSYTEEGFNFQNNITLDGGYDENVQFILEGDSSIYFEAVVTTNSVTLRIVTPIPPAIITNNQQLIFTIRADKPGALPARATIVISLSDEFTEDLILGFDRITYIGSIANDSIDLQPITLVEGYTPDVSYTLVGDLVEYFSLTNIEEVVTITLTHSIPDLLLPDNGIIVLELVASAPQTRPAHAAIILEFIREDTTPRVEQPVFGETYYTGLYTEAAGLVFDDTITLSEGYDENVQFILEGDSSIYFEAVVTTNSVTLRIVTPIPPAIITNNQQLIFTIRADKPGALPARATIVISLSDEFTEDLILGFDRITYIGSIANDSIDLQPITLVEGYTPDVSYTLVGDLVEYFSLTNIEELVTITLTHSVPDLLVPDNGIIVLELVASAPQTRPAHAAIILEFIREDTTPRVEQPVFGETYYTGLYTEAAGLVFEDTISLSEGYDENVQFILEGDSSIYFEAVVTTNSVTLRIVTPIPPAIITNNQQLIFTIRADKPGALPARATIVISLSDEFTEDLILGFDRITYIGSIANDSIDLQPITLVEGYTPDVSYTLVGDLVEYFSLTNIEEVVTITLTHSVPDLLVPDNGIIVLELVASAPQTRPAHAAIILEFIREDTTPRVEQPVFGETYYTGLYTEAAGLVFEDTISLSEGYDENVQFILEGDSSIYFEAVVTTNSVTLRIVTPIPPAIITNNQQLIFTIRADKPGALPARATIVISLSDEFTEDLILGFDRITYIGSIANDSIDLQPITLVEGYTPDVSYTLVGDLVEYFSLTNIEEVVTITLTHSIPDLLLPDNGIIVLELVASAPQTRPAHAAIILEFIREDTTPRVEQPVFGETYYTGLYTEAAGLVFDDTITLSEGYDENVQFILEGDSSIYFEAVVTTNSVTLRIVTPIPPAIITNNQQLIFTIRADKPGALPARATIVISLSDEFTEDLILGFDRITYIGSIANDSIDLQPITLVEGYTPDVSYTLVGDLVEYFSLTNIEELVTITLTHSVPDLLVPDNGIIVLELVASAPQTRPAHAAIILEFIREDTTPRVEQPVFGETYYTGLYTEAAGLVFEDTISLSEGYDENVQFILEGDSSIYFEAVVTTNSVTLRIVTPIPPAIITNNQQLIFTIRADKPGALPARATIVISLSDEFTEDLILGFDRITYIGSIANDSIDLQPITLVEGYTPDVSYTLVGDLVEYFSLTNIEEVVTITLTHSVPDLLVPDNGIIVLELVASAPQTRPAHAAIILEFIREDTTPRVEQPVFGETYYTGLYTEAAGLVFEDTISLSEGYDENVQFILEGDSSIYFEAVVTTNSVTLRIVTPIPPAIITNNQQLIFTIRADKPGALPARATIVISLSDEFTEDLILGFDRITYIGSIANDSIDLQPITLVEGYTPDVSYTLVGDLVEYFSLTSIEEVVTITLTHSIPDLLVPDNGIIVLELVASAPQTRPAHAAIILEFIREDTTPRVEQPVFGETYYTGLYTEAAGLVFDDTISLSEGYDENVQFILEGDSSIYFEAVVTTNSVTLRIVTPIPPAIITNNQQLIFTIRADKPGALPARATIVISLSDEFTEDLILGFDRITYIGSIANDSIDLQPITLVEGYTPDVSYTLVGDLVEYFSLTNIEEVVTITLTHSIPDLLLPDNGIIVLELVASAPQTRPARAAIVLEILREDTPIIEQLVFSRTYYTGHYTEVNGLEFEESISLVVGYDVNVEFVLEGDASQYFELVLSANAVALRIATPIPPAVVINNQQLIFTIHANRPGASSAIATIVISLRDENTSSGILGFNQISYTGSIENGVASIEDISLSEGYIEEVTFSIHGEFANYFTVTSEEAAVTIVMQNAIPEETIPVNRIIVLQLQASAPQSASAFATIIFEVVRQEITEMAFTEPYYAGQYTAEDELVFEDTISLSQGYDESVEFSLEGEHSQWFQLELSGNSVSLALNSAIPQDTLDNIRKLIFVIVARKPNASATRATIIIFFPGDTEDCGTDPSARFEKILFEGLTQGETVEHETITIIGYDGAEVLIFGEYAQLFVATTTNGEVTVERVGSVNLPDVVSFVALELQSGTASAVLILDVISSENPLLPEVTFSSSIYALRVEIDQTGFVGRVEATADNGEAITYSLEVDDEHLLQRISINNEGELHLSAPAHSGLYIFDVTASTIFTRVTATASAQLSVDNTTSCSEDQFVLPPLIILDRDEESPYQNLVVLNSTEFENCRYNLVNRWPIEQSWLYVDENGLHATAIDREHESIAFMALSQVQVELILECESDSTARSKRSVNAGSRFDHLGPYDYGDNKWILTDSILHNPRRSLVNLIVNDINDNAPIFVGKESEPIVVGYPMSDLEERILPRALTEVVATDADVGENAALVYWSMEDVLAVSPYSGFVHVRDNAQLENNTILTVFATDQNGQGLNGSISLLVKLIDTSHIAVVTIRDAFLDDEDAILGNLSALVGYEVKALRSTVVSNNIEGGTRRKREAVLSRGSSLQLYVYGLIEREVVNVDQFIEDINTGIVSMVNIASTISLEDHLVSLEICPLPERDTGLLVSTIVLSVLLFILIVVAAVRFFLIWRKKQNYQQFSDDNSVTSRNESLTSLPKPEKHTKPRIKIEELKRSERRLQEMLEAPIGDVTIEPSTSQKPAESKVNISEQPIVIQSIDKLKDVDESEDDDEFGEKARTKRKSVVTFNENVEKIIHVEDLPQDGEYEVYKL